MREREGVRTGQSGMGRRVSVVVPCYNAAPFLRETLDSALSQSQAPQEVIVVDDGSTDESATIAESYGPPVRVIRQENQGESVARNRGIEAAKGDWIAFLDADDLWAPTKLERQMEAAEPHVVCVHTNWYTFGTHRHVYDFSQIPAERRYSMEQYLLGKVAINPSSLMVPTSLPTRFPTWTRYAEDTFYFLEVAKRGRIVLVPEFLTAKRLHPGSQSAAIGVSTRWHETFETWLRQNEHRLDAQAVRAVRREMLARLVQETYRSYWKKHWRQFRALRQYLTRYGHDPTVRPLIAGKICPRPVHELKGVLHSLGRWATAHREAPGRRSRSTRASASR